MSERGTWLSGTIAFVLLLVLTLSLAPDNIQKDITRRASAALHDGGHDFAIVKVSGRDVAVTGTAPDDVAGAQAMAAVRGLWGVRTASEHLAVAALRAPTVQATTAREAPASSAAPALTPKRYSKRERAALAERISPELCQQLLDGLLASESIHFDSDSAVIQTRSRPLLEHVATAAVHCPDARLVLGGHTDDSGDTAVNRRLSEQRALAVAEFLAARGVSSPRIGIVGYGADRPVSNNATPAGRAMNRRIEITVEQ